MIVILEKRDLIPESRHKVIDEIEFRNDFIYDWAGNSSVQLVMLRYQGELKVFRSSGFGWEGQVCDAERIFELIHKFLTGVNYETFNIPYAIQCLTKRIKDKKQLLDVSLKIQKELFERS